MVASLCCCDCCKYKYFVHFAVSGFVRWGENPNPFFNIILNVYEGVSLLPSGDILSYDKRYMFSVLTTSILNSGYILEGKYRVETGELMRDNGNGGHYAYFFSNNIFLDVMSKYNSFLDVPSVYDEESLPYTVGNSYVFLTLPFEDFASSAIYDFLLENNLLEVV